MNIKRINEDNILEEIEEFLMLADQPFDSYHDRLEVTQEEYLRLLLTLKPENKSLRVIGRGHMEYDIPQFPFPVTILKEEE